MKIVHFKPIIYDRCHREFGVEWDEGIIMTYGDTVYCKFELSPDLEIHEAVHVKQQTLIGKDKWWERYFRDPQFRLAQELEAYQAQIDWMRENYPRSQRRGVERSIYKMMAKLYGGMCTEEEAKRLLA